MCGDSLEIVAKAVLPGVSEQTQSSLGDVVGCNGGCSRSQQPSEDNDTVVIYHGSVLTMARGKFSPADAFAVRNGVIIAVGTLAEVKAAVGVKGDHAAPDNEKVKIVDYTDKFLMPGFIDPHMHLLLTTLNRIPDFIEDFSYTEIQTRKAALDKVKEKSLEDKWLMGFGYDPSLMEDHHDLTRKDLDEAAKGNPVYIVNQSGHVGYANTAAFQDAKIGVEPSEPGYPSNDGNYEKDANGNLTGIVLEDAVKSMAAYVPQLSPNDVITTGRDVLRGWARKGTTTVFDCGIGQHFGMQDLALLKEITSDTPDLLPRFRGAMVIQTMEALIPFLEFGIAPPPWKVGCVEVYGIKLWLDGSTQGLTAALNEHYLDRPDNRGILNYRTQMDDVGSPADDDQLFGLIKPFVTHGWQIVCHTNGVRALEMALRVYARVFATVTPRTAAKMRGHMHRLEHVTADVTPAHLERAATLGLSVSHLIAHVHRWGHAFQSWVLGPSRAAHIDPVRDSVHSGVTWSFHSDSPVSESDPLKFVETAVEREMEGTNEVLGCWQRINVEEAFAGITYNPAIQLGAADEIGSLEWGKKADFVVLDRDPRKANHVTDINVLETWIGGEVAFKEEA